MKRKVIWILIAIVVSVFILGCSEPPPDQGYVTAKKFDPAHTVRHPGYPYCIYRDTKGICYVWGETPDRYENIPDRWYLHLKDCITKDNGKEKCRSGWKQVSEHEYNSYSIGSHYPDPK